MEIERGGERKRETVKRVREGMRRWGEGADRRKSERDARVCVEMRG